MGLRIKERRRALGFTQESLAYAAKLDRSYIGGIERGERNITIVTLSNIVKCLDCSIEELLRGIPYE